MTDTNIYRDIAARTDGAFMLGVVGPVRTGKSTFIKRFMETLVIPRIDNTYMKERARHFKSERHGADIPHACGFPIVPPERQNQGIRQVWHD